jgi:rare lipoprotein A
MTRPMSTLRRARPAHIAAGALALAAPSSAYALSSPSASAAFDGVSLHLAAGRVRYGRQLALWGSAGPSAAHEPLALELQPAGAPAFTVIRRLRAGARGDFRLRLGPAESGLLRVAVASGAAASAGAPAQIDGLTAGSPSGTTTASRPAQLTVRAALRVKPRLVARLGSGRTTITGALLPARAGRTVELVELSHRRLERVATARTGGRGRFALRLRSSVRPGVLRVRFAGDRFNARVSAPAGRVLAFQSAVASWYDDAGQTACGFHAYYGVANVSLPCGTRVAFAYGGHTVTATVDDRGPYVGGRAWDLNQNTAAALGFGGVATVRYAL